MTSLMSRTGSRVRHEIIVTLSIWVYRSKEATMEEKPSMLRKDRVQGYSGDA
jgi:hypothetical protein